MTFEFKGDTMTVSQIGKADTVRIDPRKTPQEIDLRKGNYTQEEKLLAIYKIDKDVLSICFGENERPTTFTVGAGGGELLFVLKRNDANVNPKPTEQSK